MINKIKSMFSTKTGRDTQIVFITTVINAASGGLFFILVPRILGPSDYGIFVTVISTAALASSISNFGIDTGILKFLNTKLENFNQIVSFAFRAYLLLGLSVAIIGFFLSPYIANLINYPQASNLLRIAFFGNILVLLTNFYTAVLQAKKDFVKAALVGIFGNVARLIVLVVAILFINVGLFQMTLIFFLSVIFSIFYGFGSFKFKLEKLPKNESVNFFKYNSWVAFTLIISSIPFENYLLVKLGGATEAGIYAAPFKILTFVYQFGGNFTRVLASRYSSFDNHDKAKIFSNKLIYPVALISVCLIVLIPLAPVLTLLLFARPFLASAFTFQILIFGFIFFFWSTVPSSLILYYFGKSNSLFIITLLKYLVFVFLLIILIPNYKANGAAIGFSVSELVSFVLMLSYVLFKFKKAK